jgi:hypothetical protein
MQPGRKHPWFGLSFAAAVCAPAVTSDCSRSVVRAQQMHMRQQVVRMPPVTLVLCLHRHTQTIARMFGCVVLFSSGLLRP